MRPNSAPGTTVPDAGPAREEPWWLTRRPPATAAFLTGTSGAVLAGTVAWALGANRVADGIWALATLAALVPAVWWVGQALRERRTGVDAVAVLALVGTLLIGEFLAGALIAAMLATGRALESYAARRARRDLTALLELAPRRARRLDGQGIQDVPLEAVRPGDLLVVGPGEVVPADGAVQRVAALLDESVLSGESELAERAVGDLVRSGAVNAGAAFTLRCTASVEQSTYAGIVRLAEAASARGAPVVRLADRYATVFLPLALAVSGLAWALTTDLARAVAVLVVATPCPLLLAAPVAVVAGMSRSARRGVVVRDGAGLELLGRARTLVLDKTGTLTSGRPEVTEIVTAPGVNPADALRLAASLSQISPHVLAEALVRAARGRGVDLPVPTAAEEVPGQGTVGQVDGHRVRVGRMDLPADPASWQRRVLSRAELDGSAVSWVAVDGQAWAAILLRDSLRPDAPRTVRRLRAAGLSRLLMLTGDRPEPAREIALAVGLDGALARLSPQDKVDAVGRERRDTITVMVGDGVNDAPALAAADVGVAMGARGSTASSELSDVVLTTDRLERLADAIEIARRARSIAVQSAVAGMAMSLAAMLVAALGHLPPTAGALLQEGIDATVILNALRALGGADGISGLDQRTEQMVREYGAQHVELRDTLTRLRGAADQLTREGASVAALDAVRRAHDLIERDLVPHERAEQRLLYPALEARVGGAEAMAPMSRTHAEIERLTDRIGVHLTHLGSGQRPDPDQFSDLVGSLYGLYAVLRLHFTQEEESYFSLVEPVAPARR